MAKYKAKGFHQIRIYFVFSLPSFHHFGKTHETLSHAMRYDDRRQDNPKYGAVFALINVKKDDRRVDDRGE